MIYDCTQLISDRLPVWPGDPPVVIHRPGAIVENGLPEPSVSRLSLGSHAGTHVDPPAHFFPGAATVEQLALETLVGPAWVAELTGEDLIRASSLAAAGIPAGTTRLLLRTRNSRARAAEATFDPDFAGLTADAAEWVLARRVRLIGIDGPSIEPFDSPGEPVHRMLLSARVIVVEGLALAGVPAGAGELICLPLPIAGGDGSPARVVLIR